MTSEDTIARRSQKFFSWRPFDHVRAQLARQKWAVDTRNEGALYNIYTADCTLILKNDGADEVARVQGRNEIIAHMTGGWQANAAHGGPAAWSTISARSSSSRPRTA